MPYDRNPEYYVTLLFVGLYDSEMFNSVLLRSFTGFCTGLLEEIPLKRTDFHGPKDSARLYLGPFPSKKTAEHIKKCMQNIEVLCRDGKAEFSNIHRDALTKVSELRSKRDTQRNTELYELRLIESLPIFTGFPTIVTSGDMNETIGHSSLRYQRDLSEQEKHPHLTMDLQSYVRCSVTLSVRSFN